MTERFYIQYKEEGKSLSTNDYTDNDKNKLSSLANIKSVGTGLSLNPTTGELTNTSGKAEWGSIEGTLDDQTDLKDALNGKLDKEPGTDKAGKYYYVNSSGVTNYVNLPVASTTTKGICKPDGTTLTVDANGVMSTLTGSAAWGNITGTLSNQTDLQNELDKKLTTPTNIPLADGTGLVYYNGKWNLQSGYGFIEVDDIFNDNITVTTTSSDPPFTWTEIGTVPFVNYNVYAHIKINNVNGSPYEGSYKTLYYEGSTSKIYIGAILKETGNYGVDNEHPVAFLIDNMTSKLSIISFYQLSTQCKLSVEVRVSPLDSKMNQPKWGNISGNYSDQIDLKAAIDGKMDATSRPLSDNCGIVYKDGDGWVNTEHYASIKYDYYASGSTDIDATSETGNYNWFSIGSILRGAPNEGSIYEVRLSDATGGIVLMNRFSAWKSRTDTQVTFIGIRPDTPATEDGPIIENDSPLAFKYVANANTGYVACYMPVGVVEVSVQEVTDLNRFDIDYIPDLTIDRVTNLQDKLDDKQNVLVSGTNIKTINSQSILGSGDIVVGGSATWGSITGDITTQTDLQNALNGKQATITSSAKLSSDLISDTGNTNKFVTSTEKTTWNGKQNQIDSTNKLSSDFVDATGNTNKFVTSAEKNTWNGKQNQIDSSNKLSSDFVDTTGNTNKFVTSAEKTAWNGKQDALVSGTNIKTINSQSILGSGDITISGGGATWGSITGEITNQSDLMDKLDKKMNLPTGVSDDGTILVYYNGEWRPQEGYGYISRVTALDGDTITVPTRSESLPFNWVEVGDFTETIDADQDAFVYVADVEGHAFEYTYTTFNYAPERECIYIGYHDGDRIPVIDSEDPIVFKVDRDAQKLYVASYYVIDTTATLIIFNAPEKIDKRLFEYTWGDITGWLPDQEDLSNALNQRVPIPDAMLTMGNSVIFYDDDWHAEDNYAFRVYDMVGSGHVEITETSTTGDYHWKPICSVETIPTADSRCRVTMWIENVGTDMRRFYAASDPGTPDILYIAEFDGGGNPIVDSDNPVAIKVDTSDVYIACYNAVTMDIRVETNVYTNQFDKEYIPNCVPNPPATGTYVLKSIDGVLEWIGE